MLDKNQLQTALANALNQLYSRDTFLIREDVNERSLSYRLAMYLQAEIDIFENGWNIDCEYNRIGTSKIEGEFLTKRMDLPVRNNVTSEDVKATTVFPDINVHHRGEEGSNNNLLVVEIKKNKEKDEYDFKKIEEYGKQLKYQWGVYINLSPTEPMMTWWEKGILIENTH